MAYLQHAVMNGQHFWQQGFFFVGGDHKIGSAFPFLVAPLLIHSGQHLVPRNVLPPAYPFEPEFFVCRYGENPGHMHGRFQFQ